MIFITTGTQEPFDRLIKVIDEIAICFPEEKFVVQAFEKEYTPKNIKIEKFIHPERFNNIFDNANLIISHAGMGTILSAMSKKKPIIVMPRLLRYKEHRNEHQLATAKKMKELNYVEVAFDENELKKLLMSLLGNKRYKSLHEIQNYASSELINELRQIINR